MSAFCEPPDRSRTDPLRASPTAGNGLASLLLGTGSGGQVIQGFKNVAVQSFYWAAYGHLYGISHQAAHGTFGTQGFRRDHPWVTSLDGITPLNLLRDPFPTGFPATTGASAGLLTQVGTNIAAFVQNTVAPWMRQTSLSIQHARGTERRCLRFFLTTAEKR